MEEKEACGGRMSPGLRGMVQADGWACLRDILRLSPAEKSDCARWRSCDADVAAQDYINIELDNHRNQLIRV